MVCWKKPEQNLGFDEDFDLENTSIPMVSTQIPNTNSVHTEGFMSFGQLIYNLGKSPEAMGKPWENP